MLGLGLGLAGGAHGWVAGRLLGCSYYLVLGSAAPAPGFLGTQPPCATQALIFFLTETSGQYKGRLLLVVTFCYCFYVFVE